MTTTNRHFSISGPFPLSFAGRICLSSERSTVLFFPPFFLLVWQIFNRNKYASVDIPTQTTYTYTLFLNSPSNI